MNQGDSKLAPSDLSTYLTKLNLLERKYFMLESDSKKDYQFRAVLGDLEHKKDVYLALNRFDFVAAAFISAEAHAKYLRDKRPDLVPPKEPNGTLPSIHRVSTAFEFHYWCSPDFRHAYLNWFYMNHVRNNYDSPGGRTGVI